MPLGARQREAFLRLGESKGYGSWLAPLGEADLDMYLGRAHDAVALLEPAISNLREADDDFTEIIDLGDFITIRHQVFILDAKFSGNILDRPYSRLLCNFVILEH